MLREGAFRIYYNVINVCSNKNFSPHWDTCLVLKFEIVMQRPLINALSKVAPVGFAFAYQCVFIKVSMSKLTDGGLLL